MKAGGVNGCAVPRRQGKQAPPAQFGYLNIQGFLSFFIPRGLLIVHDFQDSRFFCVTLSFVQLFSMALGDACIIARQGGLAKS